MMYPCGHSRLCRSPVAGKEEGLGLEIGLVRLVCRVIFNQRFYHLVFFVSFSVLNRFPAVLNLLFSF